MPICGARLLKKPGNCKKHAMRGYPRCLKHMPFCGGWYWRHGTEEDQARIVGCMQDGFANWQATRDKSQPYPCVRKSGDAYWTPATVQTNYKQWPMSWGWRLSAAKAGKLPCVLAVLDPAEAERRLLWSLPDSDALGIVEEEMALRGGKGPPQAKRRSRQIPP